MRAAIQDDAGFDDEPEEQLSGEPTGELLSEEDRDLLIKRLAGLSLPTREIIRITGASGRTVARAMQRLGILRKKPEKFRSLGKRHAQRLVDILTQYYSLEEVTLDSLHQLARVNGISLEKLLNLVRAHVSPARWAIRTCLACGQSALTSSPSDRYCATCKKKVKKVRKGLEDSAIYG